MKQTLRTAFATLTAAAALTGAGLAQAGTIETPPADPPVVRPAPQVANWAGFYGGLSYGKGKGTVKWEDRNGGWYTFAPGSKLSQDSDAGGFGAQMGYNWQTSSNLVFGVELSGMALSLETNENSKFFPGTDRLGTSIDRPIALTGKIGYATGRWLPYAEAGFAIAQVGIDNVDSFCVPKCIFRSDERHNGYVLGAGLSYKVSQRSSVGINYRHYDFGTVRHKGRASNINTAEAYDTRARMGVVSVVWNYHFN
ncbi:outer membrane protein [Tropicibacter oceani]|uniref:Outer membrane beta-barrel protein n=1 Tax=Tropicibacter oceani TaxID=3058420 RepID=A0ABY8QG81_9RHOB|nr:outer membrane beta-barrel protein [Tropicibacter oceani]WGW03006.1 outer membrane beta-barrel protein [Tropicibacter oceani]